MVTEIGLEVVRQRDDATGNVKFVRKSVEHSRSAEILEKALSKLGLTRNEARVYLHLARHEEQKASEISEALCLHRTETYRILRDLEKQGLVSSVFEKPIKFIATPFKKAIEILIESKKLKLQLLEQKKDTLVNAWFSLPQTSIHPERKESFQILEGQQQIDLKAIELLNKAKSQVLVFASKTELARLYYSSVFDKLERCVKNGVEVRFLAEKLPNTQFFTRKTRFEVCYALPLTVEGLPSFMVVDGEQLLLSMTKNDEEAKEFTRGRKATALATNYSAFVKILNKLFVRLWEDKEKAKAAPVIMA
ncbi:MAG: helix-turn-helix domain-containing protein [Candidatus Bathyarchaeia archaeon]